MDLIGPGTWMPIWPIATAASSVAVTLPRLNPASFFGPIQKPTASARKMASSGFERSMPTIHAQIPIRHLLTPGAVQAISATMTVPQIARNTLPTAYATP